MVGAMDDYDLPGDIECRAELPRPVIQIGMPPDIQRDLSKYIANRNAIEIWKLEADALHSANLGPMEHNAKNAEIVARFLSQFIDACYVSTRPVGLTFVKHSRSVPGYVNDLKLAYPTSDGYDNAIEEYKLRLDTLKDHARQIEEKKEAEFKAMIPSNLELAARHLCLAIHDRTFSGSDTQYCEMVQVSNVTNELVELEKQLEIMANARKTTPV